MLNYTKCECTYIHKYKHHCCLTPYMWLALARPKYPQYLIIVCGLHKTPAVNRHLVSISYQWSPLVHPVSADHQWSPLISIVC